ncbi:TPA: hypothetical protein DEW05_02330 [Candidatus Saccharibacteria bacterium]|nr:hypothetical protein [Candidatus Saccharibacteria bacterium]
MHTSTRLFEARNPTGRKLLDLVDHAQATFPEQSNWISRNWEHSYKVDGSGFKHVIGHLEDVTCSDRTPEQEKHLEAMRAFAIDTWH